MRRLSLSHTDHDARPADGRMHTPRARAAHVHISEQRKAGFLAGRAARESAASQPPTHEGHGMLSGIAWRLKPRQGLPGPRTPEPVRSPATSPHDLRGVPAHGSLFQPGRLWWDVKDAPKPAMAHPALPRNPHPTPIPAQMLPRRASIRPPTPALQPQRTYQLEL